MPDKDKIWDLINEVYHEPEFNRHYEALAYNNSASDSVVAELRTIDLEQGRDLAREVVRNFCRVFIAKRAKN